MALTGAGLSAAATLTSTPSGPVALVQLRGGEVGTSQGVGSAAPLLPEGADLTIIGDTIVIPDAGAEDDGPLDTELSIKLDNPSEKMINDAVGELVDIGLAEAEPETIPTASRAPLSRASITPMAVGGQVKTPSGVNLRCSVSNYRYSDSNGTFNIRNNCKYKTVNWGYQLSAGVQSITTSTIAETGMSWSKLFTTQPRNAPHPAVPKNYAFHGTFKPTKNGDSIGYNDQFVFRVNVGGRTGTATLKVFGWGLKLTA